MLGRRSRLQRGGEAEQEERREEAEVKALHAASSSVAVAARLTVERDGWMFVVANQLRFGALQGKNQPGRLRRARLGATQPLVDNSHLTAGARQFAQN